MNFATRFIVVIIFVNSFQHCLYIYLQYYNSYSFLCDVSFNTSSIQLKITKIINASGFLINKLKDDIYDLFDLLLYVLTDPKCTAVK